MFGYLVANNAKLTKTQKEVYRQYYCGLCTTLKRKYGNIGAKTLSYDLTVIGMLLTSIYNDEHLEKNICPLIHTKKNCVQNKYLDFASDMNIVLSYYKAIDDYHDDNSKSAKKFADKLEPFVKEIQMKYPIILNTVQENLKEISLMEKHNETNPDLPANLFGGIMSQILHVLDDENTDNLLKFGFYLGKFIYLMDAVCDLKSDLKHEKYNPLIQFDSKMFQEILELNMAECTKFYETMPINLHKDIIDNVLYSGVWSKFDLNKKGVKVNG